LKPQAQQRAIRFHEARSNIDPMNLPLRKSWTQEEFLAWAEGTNLRYEFDGTRPIAVTGGEAAQSLIMRGLHRALDVCLRRGPCQPLGPEAGVQTVNKAVRYPDALVTCSKFALEDKVIPGVVAAFEIVISNSSRVDRIIKVREYAAVPSIRRYGILESTSIGLTVLERSGPDEVWRTVTLTGGDILRMPEIGIEIPVTELYEDIGFPDDKETASWAAFTKGRRTLYCDPRWPASSTCGNSTGDPPGLMTPTRTGCGGPAPSSNMPVSSSPTRSCHRPAICSPIRSLLICCTGERPFDA
jgi:Uma2 family endonuclease